MSLTSMPSAVWSTFSTETPHDASPARSVDPTPSLANPAPGLADVTEALMEMAIGMVTMEDVMDVLVWEATMGMGQFW